MSNFEGTSRTADTAVAVAPSRSRSRSRDLANDRIGSSERQRNVRDAPCPHRSAMETSIATWSPPLREFATTSGNAACTGDGCGSSRVIKRPTAPIAARAPVGADHSMDD